MGVGQIEIGVAVFQRLFVLSGNPGAQRIGRRHPAASAQQSIPRNSAEFFCIKRMEEGETVQFRTVLDCLHSLPVDRVFPAVVENPHIRKIHLSAENRDRILAVQPGIAEPQPSAKEVVRRQILFRRKENIHPALKLFRVPHGLCPNLLQTDRIFQMHGGIRRSGNSVRQAPPGIAFQDCFRNMRTDAANPGVTLEHRTKLLRRKGAEIRAGVAFVLLTGIEEGLSNLPVGDADGEILDEPCLLLGVIHKQPSCSLCITRPKPRSRSVPAARSHGDRQNPGKQSRTKRECSPPRPVP